MKKIFLSVFFALIVLTGILDTRVFATGPETGDLAYYLKPWEEVKNNIKSDELEKWKAILRMYMATESCSFTESPMIVNGSEQIIVKIEGQETKVIFDGYVREGNKVSYYSPCGKIELTPVEFEAVKNDIINIYKEAVAKAWQEHQRLTPLIMARTVLKMGMALKEFEEKLREKIPGTDITYGEIAQLNEITKKDFVLKEFHLGVIEAWGLTWLNTGTVLYSPQARIYDYLNDEPLVVMHELIHANPKLQKMPIAWYFDAELGASFIEAVSDKLDTLTFLRHGYLNDVRWAARVFFSFDSEKVFKEMIKFRWSKNQIEIDERAFRVYEEQIKKIRVELKKELFEEIIPEFYSDPLLWITVNERYEDQNAYFKILMSAHYDPTLLGGHQKTMRWAAENSEKLKELAENAWRDTAKPHNELNKVEEDFLKKIANIAKMLGLSQTQIDSLVKKYGRTDVSDLKNWFWNLFDSEIFAREKDGGVRK